MKKYVYVLLLSLAALASCKKDLNFDKFNDIKLRPELGFPVAILNIKMSDIFKQNDSTIKYDPDGLIRFVFKQDSIANFSVDSILKSVDIDPVINQTKLGEIDINDFTIKSKQRLDTLVDGFSPAAQTTLSLIKNTNAVFPALDESSSKFASFNTADNFVDVTFSSGFLIVEFGNYLPITISELRVNVYNQVPFTTLIGSLNYTNIPPNSSKKDSLNLAGVTLSSALSYNLPIFKSLSSGSPVFVNPTDSVTILASSRNLKAIRGTAIFPSQAIDPEIFETDFANPDGERIKILEFSSGVIDYSVSSNVQEPIQVKIDFPGSTKNGNPFPSQFINVNNNTSNGQIDLSGVKFRLDQNTTTPYNKFKVQITPSIISSNTPKTFDSSNAINASFVFNNIKPKMVEGYLGTKNIDIEPGEFDAEFFSVIESGLFLEDPVIKLNTANSVGAPITLFFDLEGIRNIRTQKLNATPAIVSYPTPAQKGQTISGQIAINKNNSQIRELLAIAPTKLNFGGLATVNAAGFTGFYNDFVGEGESVVVGVEMEMPFSLRSTEFVMIDTIGNFVPTDTSDIEYVDVITKIENGFPFNGGFKFYFVDSSFNIIDSLASPILFGSGVPDANGRVVTKTTKVETISFTDDFVKKLIANKVKDVIFRTNINTYANGTVPVKIFSDYETKIGLTIKTKLKGQ